MLCKIRLRKGGGEGKKVRLKSAESCFGDHIIPYHKAKMLCLSNLEEKKIRIAGVLKLHVFGFSVLTTETEHSLFLVNLVEIETVKTEYINLEN